MAQQVAQMTRGPIEYRLEGRGSVVMVLNGGHCSRDTRLSHERLAEHGFSVLTPYEPCAWSRDALRGWLRTRLVPAGILRFGRSTITPCSFI